MESCDWNIQLDIWVAKVNDAEVYWVTSLSLKIREVKNSTNHFDLYDYFVGMLTRCKVGQPERRLQGALCIVGLQSHEERQLIQNPPKNVNGQWRFRLTKPFGKNLFFLFEVTLSSNTLQTSERNPRD